jgi:hypothetical protein
MGTPSLNIPGLGFGESSANTLAGPPESTIPTGFCFRMSESFELYGRTEENTLASLILLAMTWVYWDPKSRTTIVCGIMLK